MSHFHIVGSDSLGLQGGVICCISKAWNLSDFRILLPSFAIMVKVFYGSTMLRILSVLLLLSK